MDSTAPAAVPPRTVPPSIFAPLATGFNAAAAGFIAILLITDLVLAHTARLGGVAAFLNGWPALVLLPVCAAYCLWRPLPRLIDSCVWMFWGVLLGNLLSLLVLIAGRSPRPLCDIQLAAMDAGMGFSTAAVVHWAAHAPVVRFVLGLSYGALGPLVLMGLLVPPVFGKAAATRRFLLGATLCTLITAAGFALWPAAGPWTVEPYHPSQVQAGIAAYLLQLKAPGPALVDAEKTAIIAFPSLHVALAIVIAMALNSLRPLRIPVWIVTALICISTLTTGWHYLTDVLGGLGVSMVSLLAARYLERWLARADLQPEP